MSFQTRRRIKVSDRNSVRSSWIKNLACSRDLFAVTDSNGDGKITFNEWRDSAVRSTFNDENNATLFETWANYDTANIGYLTEDEAVNRRA
jgi:hypothetical protein